MWTDLCTCTLYIQEKKRATSFSSVWPNVCTWDGFSQASHGAQHTFREMKWHRHNLQDFSPCHWSLNIVNSCVKVSVVVINKHAQRDLLFDKRSRSKCHLTECFWELPWSSVFVAMETDKQRFLWQKRGSAGRARVVGDGRVLCTMNSTIQHLISSLFLSFSLPCIYLNVFSVLFVILSVYSARWMVIFDTVQLWHHNQHFPPTPLPTRTWTRNK